MIILSGGLIVNEKFIKLVKIKEDKWGVFPQSELYKNLKKVLTNNN